MPRATENTNEVLAEGINEENLFELINDAIGALNSSTDETMADELIYDHAKRVHEEFQRKLEASIPSFTDRQRVYNL